MIESYREVILDVSEENTVLVALTGRKYMLEEALQTAEEQGFEKTASFCRTQLAEVEQARKTVMAGRIFELAQEG